MDMHNQIFCEVAEVIGAVVESFNQNSARSKKGPSTPPEMMSMVLKGRQFKVKFRSKQILLPQGIMQPPLTHDHQCHEMHPGEKSNNTFTGELHEIATLFRFLDHPIQRSFLRYWYRTGKLLWQK